MSRLAEPKPVKLITGVIYRPDAEIGRCLEALSRELGEAGHTSGPRPFDSTPYYRSEMGDGLSRIFVAYKKLIARDKLRDIKIFTNELEKVFSYQNKRTVNIDPGYIAEEHLILATGKGYAHRPYLGSGVYADLTLMYVNDDWRPLEWTYPDYRGEEVLELFRKLRREYSKQLKKEEQKQ